MRIAPVLPDTEKALRLKATRPDVHAWVLANAGSGKTTILGNRVIRLLLAGTLPDRILCLTFTKAAAAEMQTRIFRELGRWVRLDDDELDAAIRLLTTGNTEGTPVERTVRERARTLFAAAIETPGGLKIQTIHAFAERILHLFPFEAGAPIDFEVLTEGEAEEMMAKARRAIVDAAVSAASSRLGMALTELLDATNDARFFDLVGETVSVLGRLVNRGGSLPSEARRAEAYRAYLGVPDGESGSRIAADLLAEAWSGDRLVEIADAITAQKNPSGKQLNLAADLHGLAKAERGKPGWIDDYCAVFLTKDGEPLKKGAFTNAVHAALPWLKDAEAIALDAVLSYRARLGAFRLFTRSLALSDITEAVLGRYESEKQAANRLDFDDLIAAVRRLLSGGQANWVQLRLDAGIDHVLVDEAQDTTPEMWDIVRGLTDEFFAGKGARPRSRSLFVVGDEKQSIYSFQGADPDAFEATRLYFSGQLTGPNHIARPIELISSFRSSADVLTAVDKIFAQPERREGLTAGAAQVSHIAARQNFPGLVEIWEPERQERRMEGGPMPVPAPVILADRIADMIAEWFVRGERHLEDGAPIQPGDILILVRKRGPFFFAMLRALRHRRIPVAGADRLRLAEEIGINDLLVIAEVVLQREDDLALATALKTPFFGLDDADLERFARDREGALYGALRASADPRLSGFAETFDRWRVLAESADPFTFFATLLTEPAPGQPCFNGRQALLTRLGPDVAEPLDAFLAQAQDFAIGNVPSLLSFVAQQRRQEGEIKRDLEQGAGAVRVMTVHGAKGLEARVVFLADSAHRPKRDRSQPIHLAEDAEGSGLLLWPMPGEGEPSRLATARREKRRASYREHRRLLYVGMTRASDRLYLVGHAEKLSQAEIDAGVAKPPPEDPLEWSWYDLAGAAFKDVEPAEIGTRYGPRRVTRIESKIPPAKGMADPPSGAPEPAISAPSWLNEKVAEQDGVPGPPLRPSRRGVLPGDDGGLMRAKGVLLHRLYEILPAAPAERRRDIAKAATAQILPALMPFLDEMLRPVLGLIDSAAGKRIFSARSRAEVAISGLVTLETGGMRPVSGRIDRLIVEENRIEIIDFKTGQMRTATKDPEILRQMALYRVLGSNLFPARSVSCAILWTETGVLDPIPDDALYRAFAAITEA